MRNIVGVYTTINWYGWAETTFCFVFCSAFKAIHYLWEYLGKVKIRLFIQNGENKGTSNEIFTRKELYTGMNMEYGEETVETNGHCVEW